MSKLVENRWDLLTDSTYPHLALIKTFTDKNLVCRLNFSTTSIYDILQNIATKINYKSNYNINDIGLVHNNKLIINKDMPIDRIVCTQKIEQFKMTYFNNDDINCYISDELSNKLEKSTTCFFVKSLSGKNIVLKYVPELTIKDIKKLIYFKESIPPSQVRLIFHGNQLDNEKNVTQYNIVKDCTIYLMLCLRGGMFHETSGRDGIYGALDSCIIDIDPIED